MTCPYCNSPTNVTNSRSRAKGTQVWRRRKCAECNSIWSTHEVIDLSTSHRIVSPEGRLQAFSRDKLYSSIKDSLRHRKTATEDSTALTDTVIARLLGLGHPRLESKQLKKTTHEVILAFDPVAAGVYLATT